MAPHRNLVFDPIAGWWDVTGFGGGIWCGQSYDGDWAIRACVTSLAPPATYPGTGEDFIQRSALDGAVLDTVDIKPVAPFQLVTVALASPGQTFVGSPLALVAELFTTGAPPAPAFPGIAVSGQLSTIVVIGTATSPFGSPLLPPTQTAVSFVVSPVLVGQSVLFQGLVPATFARNGIFASTPGHELVVQ